MVSLESEIPSMNNENFVADDCKQEMNTKLLDDGKQKSELTNMKSDNL